MSDDPAPAGDTPELRRRRLIGRLVVIAFGILLLVYFVPLALNFLP